MSSPLADFDALIFNEGFASMAGVDEAGRGPLAGPVFAACCQIPRGVVFPGIDDSKKLSEKARNQFFLEITEHPEVNFGIAHVTSSTIDEINILQATMLAMKKAIRKLIQPPEILLVDGLLLPGIKSQVRKLIQGDSKSQAIAAASILAKVSRDKYMKKQAQKWPKYGFHSHKGYGTKQHLEALAKHGPCPIHRFSFAPVALAKNTIDSI